MTEPDQTGIARRYVCLECDSEVRARWQGCGSFEVGCDCTTVPIVPQVGQGETPEKWRVEREDCCSNAEVSSLETVYEERGDYRCPDCGAVYEWDGTMVDGPSEWEDAQEDDSPEILTDGGTDSTVTDQYGTIEEHVGTCRTCDRRVVGDGSSDGFESVERELASHIDDGTACHDYSIQAVYQDGGERRV